MNVQESRAAFLAIRPILMEQYGVAWEPGCEPYGLVSSDPERGCDPGMAMDALPTLTLDPNAGIPTMFTTWVDPNIYEVMFSPLRATEIIGPERRTGDWTEQTAMFPIEEVVGETTAYGDYNNSGENSGNVNFPQRQAFLFQTIIEYGDLEVARYARARVNWITAKQRSRVRQLNTYHNFSYFYGIAGIQCYGLLNDPNLPAALTPAPKAYGGNAWVVGNVVVASANEIYNDIQSLYMALVTQSAGLIDEKTPVVLAMSPGSSIALTATNSFNVNVRALLKDNFPNIRIETAVQYGALSAANPQGNLAGNLVQMIAESLEGQQAGYAAFNEKQRSHNMVKALSSMKQKKTSGTWGTIIRMPVCFAQMVGV